MDFTFTWEKLFYGVIEGSMLAAYLLSWIILFTNDWIDDESAKQEKELAWILKKMDNIKPNSHV